MRYITKIITALAALIIVIIAASLLTQNYLEKTSAKLEKRIVSLEKGIHSGDWSTVNENLKSAGKAWKNSKGKWAVLIDHMEIDNIDTAFSRMSEYIGTRDVPSALAEASVLKLYLRHIPEREALNLSNIL